MAGDNPILRQLARSLSRSGVMPSRAARVPRNEKVIEATPEPEAPTFVYGEASDNWEPQHQPRVQKILEQRSVPRGEQNPGEPEKKDRRGRPRKYPIENEEEATKKYIMPESQFDAEKGTETVHVVRTIKRSKRRNITMGFSVSEEEEHIIREFLVQKDKTFSKWAREVIFAAIGRAIPQRPDKN